MAREEKLSPQIYAPSDKEAEERLSRYPHVQALFYALAQVETEYIPNADVAHIWRDSCKLYANLDDRRFLKKNGLIPTTNIYPRDNKGYYDGSLALYDEDWRYYETMVTVAKRRTLPSITAPIEAFVEESELDKEINGHKNLEWAKLYLLALNVEYYKFIENIHQSDRDYWERLSPNFPSVQEPLRIVFAKRNAFQDMLASPGFSGWVHSGPTLCVTWEAFSQHMLDNVFVLKDHIAHEFLLHNLTQLGDPQRAQLFLRSKIPWIIEADWASPRQAGTDVAEYRALGLSQDMLRVQTRPNDVIKALRNMVTLKRLGGDRRDHIEQFIPGMDYFLGSELTGAFYAWIAQKAKGEDFQFSYNYSHLREGYKFFIKDLLTNQVNSIDQWYEVHGWKEFQLDWQQGMNGRKYLLSVLPNKVSFEELGKICGLNVERRKKEAKRKYGYDWYRPFFLRLANDIKKFFDSEASDLRFKSIFDEDFWLDLVNVYEDGGLHQFDYENSFDDLVYELKTFAHWFREIYHETTNDVLPESIRKRLIFQPNAKKYDHAIGTST